MLLQKYAVLNFCKVVSWSSNQNALKDSTYYYLIIYFPGEYISIQLCKSILLSSTSAEVVHGSSWFSWLSSFSLLLTSIISLNRVVITFCFLLSLNRSLYYWISRKGLDLHWKIKEWKGVRIYSLQAKTSVQLHPAIWHCKRMQPLFKC